jgi:hypothetical protein
LTCWRPRGGRRRLIPERSKFAGERRQRAPGRARHDERGGQSPSGQRPEGQGSVGVRLYRKRPFTAAGCRYTARTHPRCRPRRPNKQYPLMAACRSGTAQTEGPPRNPTSCKRHTAAEGKETKARPARPAGSVPSRRGVASHSPGRREKPRRGRRPERVPVEGHQPLSPETERQGRGEAGEGRNNSKSS